MYSGVQVKKFRKIDRLQTSVRVCGPSAELCAQDKEAGDCGSSSVQAFCLENTIVPIKTAKIVKKSFYDIGEGKIILKGMVRE